MDLLSAAKFSVPVAIVGFTTSALWTRLLLFPMILVSSSSKLLMKPDGLSNETSYLSISCRNVCCQRMRLSRGGGFPMWPEQAGAACLATTAVTARFCFIPRASNSVLSCTAARYNELASSNHTLPIPGPAALEPPLP